MSLRPGALVGLPDGFPDPLVHLAASRYLLCGLAIVWALVVWKARRAWWTVAGVVWLVVVLGFWTASFGRPYGLFEDPEITQRAARISVVAYAGGQEDLLSGEDLPASWWTRLAARGVPPRMLQLLPTLLPLVVLPLLGVFAHLLWRPRPLAAFAALIWLAFSTGEPETLRGVGLASGLWRRPEVALALPALAALALLFGRWRLAGRAWPALAVVLAGAAVALPDAGPRLAPAESLLLMTLDQGPWLLLGGYGLWRRGDPTGRALTAAGAALLAAHLASAPVDAFTAHALYRLGILAAAVPVVAELCAAAGRWLASRVRGFEPESAGAAALVAVLVPGSFLAWWDPTKTDALAGASVPALATSFDEVAQWIRAETPPSAVVLASPDYAPSVAVLAGRRVLRAPTMAQPPDDWRRLRAQAAFLEGREAGRHAARYGVSHILIAPNEFGHHGLTTPEDLEAHAHFRLRYRHPEGFRVYELVP